MRRNSRDLLTAGALVATLLATGCAESSRGTNRAPAGIDSRGKRPDARTDRRPGAGRAYVFPVQPPRRARYGRGHHDYPATDIFAPAGTRFVAATGGVIEDVGRIDRWNPQIDAPETRGGLFVSLLGDDGLRYYGSHLARVARRVEPGSRVSAGELLGFVGRSGNARFTPPHLHFGISRPTYAGDWETRRGEIHPYPRLRRWQRRGAPL